MAQPSREPVVFVGPSIDHARVRELLPQAQIADPIARGDLERFQVAGASTFLIVDGVFAHRLAVSPSELLAALNAGARILGAASIGAIRAAECWPAGMQGLGAVYSLYRLRVICNDDEVAVATDPERHFTALSVALINVRYVVLRALRERLLNRTDARRLLTAARRTHFSERHWETMFESAEIRLTPLLRRITDTTDVKRRDALRALEHLAHVARAGSLGPLAPTRHRSRERAVGHDPVLGYSIATVRRELPRWLLGSGRYRRYVPTGDAITDRQQLSTYVWSKLAETNALDRELMRFYAVQRGGAQSAELPDEQQLSDARQSVAIGHGFGSWAELLAHTRKQELAGIPLEWIDRACHSLARARVGMQSTERGLLSRTS